MLGQPAAFAFNHLLGQQMWAREKLRAHAGQVVEFRSPPLPSVQFRIDDDGRVAATSQAESDLVITVKSGVVPFLLRRGSDTSHAFEFTGRAALAETMRDLLQHLEWDPEEDLSRIVGDTAAHRMASAGRQLVAWQREAAERLAQNVAEYLGEERPVLLRRPLFESFAHQNRELIDRLEALEERVRRRR
jgi:ubiquinone biosynthesis accessory factor UbiJ